MLTASKNNPKNSESHSPLMDRFNRKISYLRISVTDRCDLRCVYCMPENIRFIPRSQLLTLEEIIRIGTVFGDLGVKKIRITGGEPLTRKNVIKVFQELKQHDGIKELTLTTNGTQLPRYAQALKQAGVTRINISLDTLRPDRFRDITRTGELNKTLAGIDAALQQDFSKLKLNAVILKNRNHDECSDLVQYAIERNMDISFIEEMPLGVISDHDRSEVFYSSDQILADLQRCYTMHPSTVKTGGPSRYFSVAGSNTHVGFISPHSHNFCASCNRVRLTTEGRLLLCLGQEHSVDLRRIVKLHPQDNDPLRQAIIDSMDIKPEGHDFNLQAQPMILRHMNATGG